ncbi:MAG: hypothetical protein E7634_08370 [Ruminococcaceae bacterium]|nr:hypothetical protein [Oscillospiraceae bacterium]
MTNFKQYLRSHLKANLKPIIYIVTVVLFLTFMIAINEEKTYSFGTARFQSTLAVPVMFMSILSYVLPVMEFSFFKKRINLDCAYSMPISRRTMGTAHYISGLITLFGAFSASYLLNFIIMLSRGENYFNLKPLIPHYFLCLFLGFAMYSVMVFVFNEANTMGDGIWFMVLYSFVFVFVFSALTEMIDGMPTLYLSSAMPFGAISELTSQYQSVVENFKQTVIFWNKPRYYTGFIFWGILGIASAVGFFLTFGKKRTEKTEEISDSWFGYRTLIPIYAITGMISFHDIDIVIFWVIIELLAFLGYTIYRRGFHYKKSDLIILGILPLFLFV